MPRFSDDVGSMCFNAAKSFQLSSTWYNNNNLVIDPTQASWEGNIIGVADFARNPQNYPLVVKIETGTPDDYFIGFNRASGINQNTIEGINEVRILETGMDGEFFSQSYLKAALKEEGNTYVIPRWDGTLDLTFKLLAIVIGDESDVDHAKVSVCLGPCGSPPTMRPSYYPTTSNIRLGNYIQIGSDIQGSDTDDSLGRSVALSNDGFRVGIASPGANGGKGLTQMYKWDTDDEKWIQIGQDIVGSSAHDGLGWSIAISGDGSRFVLGAPEANSDDGLVRVYALDTIDMMWYILGNEINPLYGSKGQAGVSVAMNASGDCVAFGAPRANNYKGMVEAFKLSDGQWLRMGQTIASGEYSYSGGSIAMTANGERIVVGSQLGYYYMGNVKVYDYSDVTSQWHLIGSMNGFDYYDRFGGDIDITDDGTRIVVGAPTSDGRDSGGYNTGEFQVFEYDEGVWKRLGQKVIGDADMDKHGETVAISGDGTTVAISSPESDENGVNTGKVKVYSYSEYDQAWVPKTLDILGKCLGDKVGEGGGSIALDHSGEHIVVGAERANYYAGVSRVFKLVARSDGTNDAYNDEACP